MSRRERKRLGLAIAASTAAVLAAASLACAEGVATPALSGLEPLDSPAPPGSAEPSLAAAPDGRIWLSWIEPERPRAMSRSGWSSDPVPGGCPSTTR